MAVFDSLIVVGVCANVRDAAWVWPMLSLRRQVRGVALGEARGCTQGDRCWTVGGGCWARASGATEAAEATGAAARGAAPSELGARIECAQAIRVTEWRGGIGFAGVVGVGCGLRAVGCSGLRRCGDGQQRTKLSRGRRSVGLPKRASSGVGVRVQVQVQELVGRMRVGLWLSAVVEAVTGMAARQGGGFAAGQECGVQGFCCGMRVSACLVVW